MRYIILILVLAVFALLHFFRPGGLMAYAFPSACWGLLALATLKVCGSKKIRQWYNKRVFVMAAIAGILQIFVLIDAGVLTSFGKSPYSHTPRGLAINLIFVLSALLGTELSRAYLMKNFGRKRPVLTLGLVTLLYTFITTSIFGFLAFNEPLLLAQFLGTGFLPTVTENLLATYLALLGGPIASLAYRGPLQAFEWFSPILPDLPWGYEALIGVMGPTIGFIVVDRAIRLPRTVWRRAKFKMPRLNWTTIAVIFVLTVWFSTGLIGIRPTIIIGGSMRPTMDIGDIALVTDVDINGIKQNDIVQYWHDGTMSVHRVVDIRQTEGSKLFITKGDANKEPDINPVYPNQVLGKVVFIIPKLGSITIHTRTVLSTLWSFLLANTILTYATLAIITLTGSIYAIHAHKSRPAKRWKSLHRKRGWPRK